MYYETIMDKFSASLHNGAIRFGKYPTDEEVALLKKNGYLIFIDLCPADEITWTPYSREGIYYNSFPIADRTPNVGDLAVFREFIRRLVELLIHGYLIYVHCRGGHGRSGMFSGVLYGKITGLDGQTVLRDVYNAHQLRTEIKPQFRKMGAPQTAAQKRFVINELTRI